VLFAVSRIVRDLYRRAPNLLKTQRVVAKIMVVSPILTDKPYTIKDADYCLLDTDPRMVETVSRQEVYRRANEAIRELRDY
jgi:hypothetical protein